MSNSQWFLLIFKQFMNDSNGFSEILADSQWFFLILGDSYNSWWFSSDSSWFLVIISNSYDFYWFLNDSYWSPNDFHWFLVILLILIDSLWFSMQASQSAQNAPKATCSKPKTATLHNINTKVQQKGEHIISIWVSLSINSKICI